jgi:hypothetical protein
MNCINRFRLDLLQGSQVLVLMIRAWPYLLYVLFENNVSDNQ